MSIIRLSFFGWSFPLEVVSVVLLDVPPVLWVLDIETPAHSFCVSSCVSQSCKIHTAVWPWVKCASTPSHEMASEVPITCKVDSPSLSDSLVSWMAMDVLPLWHVDASNLVSLILGVPRTHPFIVSNWSFHIQFFSFVESYTIWVCCNIVQFVALAGDASSLYGAVFQLFTVWWSSWWLRPHVSFKCVAQDCRAFSIDHLADCSHCLSWFCYHSAQL